MIILLYQCIKLFVLSWTQLPASIFEDEAATQEDVAFVGVTTASDVGAADGHGHFLALPKNRKIMITTFDECFLTFCHSFLFL